MKGGLAEKTFTTEKDVDQTQLRIGIMIEKEHTDDEEIAKQIALDHLAEFPKYYSYLVAMEKFMRKDQLCNNRKERLWSRD